MQDLSSSQQVGLKQHVYSMRKYVSMYAVGAHGIFSSSLQAQPPPSPSAEHLAADSPSCKPVQTAHQYFHLRSALH
jgi:hypothetical protein